MKTDETKKDALDRTVAEVLDGMEAPYSKGTEVAKALGLSVDDLFETKLAIISAAQLRTLATTLGIGADELLGLGGRRKGQEVDLLDAASQACNKILFAAMGFSLFDGVYREEILSGGYEVICDAVTDVRRLIDSL